MGLSLVLPPVGRSAEPRAESFGPGGIAPLPALDSIARPLLEDYARSLHGDLLVERSRYWNATLDLSIERRACTAARDALAAAVAIPKPANYRPVLLLLALQFVALLVVVAVAWLIGQA